MSAARPASHRRWRTPLTVADSSADEQVLWIHASRGLRFLDLRNQFRMCSEIEVLKTAIWSGPRDFKPLVIGGKFDREVGFHS